MDDDAADYPDEDSDYVEGYLSRADVEPPVPPNLKHLDGALEAFSPSSSSWIPSGPGGGGRGQPRPARRRGTPGAVDWRLARGGLPALALARGPGRAQYRPGHSQGAARPLRAPAPRAPEGARRTVGALLAEVQRRRRRAADELRRQEALARAQRLEALARREPAAWDEVMAGN